MTIFPSTQVPKSAVTNPDNLELWLTVSTRMHGESILLLSEVIEPMIYSWLSTNHIQVDDELRQKGPTSDMIFKIPFLISYISSIMTLMEGDVILTGKDTLYMCNLFFGDPISVCDVICMFFCRYA